MSKTIKHFKTERIMVLHEGKNDQWGSGEEYPALALTPLDFDGSFPNTTGYTDGCDTPMPFFAFGDSFDEDDEDDMEDDDFDDNFDDDDEDFGDDKDDFNFIKDDDDDDYDEDIEDDDEDLEEDFDDDDE